jgi:hypothetical protein
MGHLVALLGPMGSSEGRAQEQEERRIAAANGGVRHVPHARWCYAVMEADVIAVVGGGVPVEGMMPVGVRMYIVQKRMAQGAVEGQRPVPVEVLVAPAAGLTPV